MQEVGGLHSLLHLLKGSPTPDCLPRKILVLCLQAVQWSGGVRFSLGCDWSKFMVSTKSKMVEVHGEQAGA